MWLHEDRLEGAVSHVDVGLTFDCPRCKELPNGREHRLELWFCATRSQHDLTIGGPRPHLFDHAGTRFHELTVWTEKPGPRDPLIRLNHWVGYIEAGTVYDALRSGW
jgi:hypothetical protein